MPAPSAAQEAAAEGPAAVSAPRAAPAPSSQPLDRALVAKGALGRADLCAALAAASARAAAAPNAWVPRERIEALVGAFEAPGGAAGGVPPAYLAEAAAAALYRRFVRRYLPADWSGAEWWCQTYRGGAGRAFHFDKDEAACALGGEVRCPAWSSVLYLNEYDGRSARLAPTVVVQETPDDAAKGGAKGRLNTPPRRSLICYPEGDQMLLFPGELSHGVLDGAWGGEGGGSSADEGGADDGDGAIGPIGEHAKSEAPNGGHTSDASAVGVADDGPERIVYLFNWWRGARPESVEPLDASAAARYGLGWMSDLEGTTGGCGSSVSEEKAMQVRVQKVTVPSPADFEFAAGADDGDADGGAGLRDAARAPLTVDHVLKTCGITLRHPERMKRSKAVLLNHDGRTLRGVSRFDVPRYGGEGTPDADFSDTLALLEANGDEAAADKAAEEEGEEDCATAQEVDGGSAAGSRSHDSDTESPAAAAMATAKQSEAALAQCEALLRSHSDERKLAGALLAARLAGAASPAALRRLYGAMGPAFIGRMLRSGDGDATQAAAYRWLSASMAAAFARGAPELAGAIAGRHAAGLARVAFDAAGATDPAATDAAVDVAEVVRACAEGVLEGAVGAAAGLEALAEGGVLEALGGLARAASTPDAALEAAVAALERAAAAGGASHAPSEEVSMRALAAVAGARAGLLRFTALGALARRCAATPESAAPLSGDEALRGAVAGVLASKVKPEHRAAALEVLASMAVAPGGEAALVAEVRDASASLTLPRGVLLALALRVCRIEIEILQNDAMRLAAGGGASSSGGSSSVGDRAGGKAAARDALAALPACYALCSAAIGALAGAEPPLPAKAEGDAFNAALEATQLASELVLELNEVGALADVRWRSLAAAAADFISRLGAEAPGAMCGTRRQAALLAAGAPDASPRVAAAAAVALLGRLVLEGEGGEVDGGEACDLVLEGWLPLLAAAARSDDASAADAAAAALKALRESPEARQVALERDEEAELQAGASLSL